MLPNLCCCRTDVHYTALRTPENVVCCKAVQKDMGCWWFGVSGRCDAYNALIVALIIFAAVQFASMIASELAGQKLSNR